MEKSIYLLVFILFLNSSYCIAQQDEFKTSGGLKSEIFTQPDLPPDILSTTIGVHYGVSVYLNEFGFITAVPSLELDPFIQNIQRQGMLISSFLEVSISNITYQTALRQIVIQYTLEIVGRDIHRPEWVRTFKYVDQNIIVNF
ncbi:hypothetical protein [Litoribacter populi]|uniref:hypothetical protein n=1 Tax=Litoribacter populi TaxID=2598460 RepID=UPI0011804EAB|nr:hypothetical protein [Litoribacter populi]